VIKINPSKTKFVDLVVGIPSYNEADGIGFVVKQVDLGLKKHFPKIKSVIINADNHSLDNTKGVFLNTKTAAHKIYISTPPGVTGKGNNFHNLFGEVINLKAKALVMIDADLKSITDKWIKKFATPILKKNYDYVTPLYTRHEYDGTITNNICYPLIYGLLGKDIRQPIGGDFACSEKLVKYLLAKKWTKSVKFYGIDIFMTINATLGGFKLCQVPLGAKIHKPSAPKLGPMFSQVTETLFRNLLTSKEKWLKLKSIEKPPIIGGQTLDLPQDLPIDYKHIKTVSISGFEQSRQMLKKTLTKKVYKKVAEMYKKRNILINKALWAKIVYDLLFNYEKEVDCQIIEAMKSLYFGRVSSFIKETLNFSHQESENEIVKQAKHFFKTRSYFLRKYGY